MDSPKILISFHILPELIDKIKSALPEAEILYKPELYGKPRYMNDQHGAPIERTPEQEEMLQSMMAKADILFFAHSRKLFEQISAVVQLADESLL